MSVMETSLNRTSRSDLIKVATVVSIFQFVQIPQISYAVLYKALKGLDLAGLIKSRNISKVVSALVKRKILKWCTNNGKFITLHPEIQNKVQAAFQAARNRTEFLALLYSEHILSDKFGSDLENFLPENIIMPHWKSKIAKETQSSDVTCFGVSEDQDETPTSRPFDQPHLVSDFKEQTSLVLSSEANLQNTVKYHWSKIQNKLPNLSQTTVQTCINKLQDQSDKTSAPRDTLLEAVMVDTVRNSVKMERDSSITVPGLKNAVEMKCWDVCEDLIKKDKRLKKKELKQLQFAKEHENVLETAVSEGFVELIKLFLHNNVPVNMVIGRKLKRGSDVVVENSCLLIFSVTYNRLDILHLLLESGADINCRRPNGETLLHICAENGYNEIMQFLISKGADVRAVDLNMNGMLHIAAMANQFGIIKLLTDIGFDVNSKGYEQNTALHIATQNNNYDIVKLLVSKGANPNLINRERNTPLRISVTESNRDIVKLLLENGADIDLEDPNKKTVLHISVEKGNFQIVKLLLAMNANTDLKDDEGNTPMHISILKDKTQIFTLLYENDANINARNVNKETPLILAAKHGRTAIAKQLLRDVYCDKNAKDQLCDKTALDWARSNGHMDIVNLFPESVNQVMNG